MTAITPIFKVTAKLPDIKQAVRPAIPQEERDRVLAAIQSGTLKLYSVDKELRSDPRIVMAAVQRNGLMLEFASPELRNNPTLVMAAIEQNPWALRYALNAPRNNPIIVRAAVQRRGGTLQYASAELKDNADMVMTAIDNDGLAYRHASERLQEIPAFAIRAAQRDATVLDFMWGDIKKNPDVIMAAVQQNGMALQHAPDELRDNSHIVAAAVRQNWRAFRFASDRLKKDPDLFHLAWEQKRAQSSQKSQVLNFMWLNLDLPALPDPTDGSIRLPLPEEYIENIRKAGERHPRADIHLWADSRRLTQKQWDYLEAVVENGMTNVHVKDLYAIPAYANEELYSRTETKENWRSSYGGVIWLQVDAAKILVSLQEDYDQRFFADLDHAHIDLESFDVQKRINEHGLLIGSCSGDDEELENQFWGFDRSKEIFFSAYYAEGLQQSYEESLIAYETLAPRVDRELCSFEDIPLKGISLPIDSIGLKHAVHPGHEWSKGCKFSGGDYKGRATVPATELAEIFNAGNRAASPSAATAAAPAKSVAPAPLFAE